MAGEHYLFLQPWLNPDETWAGFHLAASGPDACPDEVRHLFSLPEAQTVNSGLHWFVPVESAADVAKLQSVSAEKVILLLKPPADPEGQEAAEKLEADLRRAGRKVALALSPGDPLPPTGTFDYVVLAVGHARTLPPFTLMGLAVRSSIVVHSVRSRNDFSWAVSNQCHVVSGEYLLTRNSALGKADVTRLKLLELLALVAQDADTEALEEVFKQQPKLSYGLLRLVNSAAIAPRSPITSFGQAINLLGRRQLQRWLQLLVYADSGNGAAPNPLLLLAARRGRLMEILSGRIPAIPEVESTADAAFMAGTFSLLPVLLNLSMTEILPQLPLPQPVADALAHHGGALGKLLKISDSADHGELALAGSLVREHAISPDTFVSDQIEALTWAAKIRSVAA